VEYLSRESSTSGEDTPVTGPSRPSAISLPHAGYLRLSTFDEENIEVDSSMARKGKGKEVETPVDNRVEVSEFLEWGEQNGHLAEEDYDDNITVDDLYSNDIEGSANSNPRVLPKPQSNGESQSQESIGEDSNQEHSGSLP
jgi:hypothetical protein